MSAGSMSKTSEVVERNGGDVSPDENINSGLVKLHHAFEAVVQAPLRISIEAGVQDIDPFPA
ncbi:hypothetical protein D3C75_1227030 [compost metagenome]